MNVHEKFWSFCLGTITHENQKNLCFYVLWGLFEPENVSAFSAGRIGSIANVLMDAHEKF